jgi:hypothetical protein
MTSSHITPTIQLVDVHADPDVDTISLFGDEEEDGDEGERNIQLTEIESDPILIRGRRGQGQGHGHGHSQETNRDWEAKRFMVKDRVRESRLKARIAEHMAAKEEERFRKMFGDLDDNESQFSDYDLSSEGGEGEDEDEDNSS